jgi:hypothetical protein
MSGHLTAEYVQNHMRTVHTPDSWARAIAEQALQAAATAIGAKSVGEQTVDMQLKVSAFEPAGCIRICGIVNGVQICYHQSF